MVNIVLVKMAARSNKNQVMLVTGGTGFLGVEVVRLLLDAGCIVRVRTIATFHSLLVLPQFFLDSPPEIFSVFLPSLHLQIISSFFGHILHNLNRITITLQFHLVIFLPCIAG